MDIWQAVAIMFFFVSSWLLQIATYATGKAAKRLETDPADTTPEHIRRWIIAAVGAVLWLFQAAIAWAICIMAG